jgi:cytochrome bd-type quinol oxidase subunit 2
MSGTSSLSITKITADLGKVNPVFAALIIVGLFIKLGLSDVVSSKDGNSGPATSLIWGYSLIVFSLIGIVVVNSQPGTNEWSDIKHLPWILLLTIALVIWIIVINIQYYKEINLKSVPDEYNMWSGYSTMLLFCLIGVSVYQYSVDSQVAKKMNIYAMIILIFNLIAVAILQVILNCFHVDG